MRVEGLAGLLAEQPGAPDSEDLRRRLAAIERRARVERAKLGRATE